MTLIIQNGIYKVTAAPERGGKLESIIYRPGQQEILWSNHENIQKNALKCTDVFDDIWDGGWDEIFPNDAPEKAKNRRYIDHGELWYRQWEVLQAEKDIVRLKVITDKTQAEIIKEIRLTEKSLYIEHQIKNISKTSIIYTWKSHPAFNIDHVAKIELPAKGVHLSPELNSIRSKNSMYIWPYLETKQGKSIDMSKVVPEEKREVFFQFASLEEGWFKLLYDEMFLLDELVVSFDHDFFPYLTLFLVYGGWKNYYTAVVEPSTSYPEKLSETLKNKTYNQLMPLEKKSFYIELTVK